MNLGYYQMAVEQDDVGGLSFLTDNVARNLILCISLCSSCGNMRVWYLSLLVLVLPLNCTVLFSHRLVPVLQIYHKVKVLHPERFTMSYDLQWLLLRVRQLLCFIQVHGLLTCPKKLLIPAEEQRFPREASSGRTCVLQGARMHMHIHLKRSQF
jgi:hypothetical protein